MLLNPNDPRVQNGTRTASPTLISPAQTIATAAVIAATVATAGAVGVLGTAGAGFGGGMISTGGAGTGNAISGPSPSLTPQQVASGVQALLPVQGGGNTQSAPGSGTTFNAISPPVNLTAGSGGSGGLTGADAQMGFNGSSAKWILLGLAVLLAAVIIKKG